MNMRDIIDLIVTESYSMNAWERFWINIDTGDVVAVLPEYDHDGHLETHLDDFLSDFEIEQAVGDEYDRFAEGHWDAILQAVYDKGWYAVLFDHTKQELSLRGIDVRAARRIALKMSKTHPIERIALDADQSMTLDGDALHRFLKSGALPR